MMRNMIGAAAFVICGALTPANAADPSGNFAVDGVGVRSCQDFLKIRDDTEALRVFAAWTEGFFTAYNVLQDDTFDVTPWQTIELTITKMFLACEHDPELPYIRALGKLMRVMTPSRLTEQDSLVSVRNGGKSVFVYTTVLERIRESLTKAGHAPKPSDVPFDENFVKALLSYQGARDLPQTGLPDLATMNSLYP